MARSTEEDLIPKYALAVIVLAAVVLRLAFFHGIFASDQYTYCLSAWELANHHWNPAHFYEQTTRWGLILPIALFYRWFGVNELSSTLWPFLSSLLTIYIAFRLGCLLKSRQAGLLSAALVAVFPLEIIFSSQSMADGPLGFWLLLALYLFIAGDERSDRRLLYLAGIALGLAYATKIVALFIAPFFLLGMIFRKRIQWAWMLIPAGLLTVIAIEFLVFQQCFGDGLLRLHLAAGDATSHSLQITGGGSIPNSVELYLKWMLLDIRYTGPAFVVLLLIAIFRRDSLRQTGWLVLWAGVLLSILSVYPLKTSPYQPLYKLPAYMLMFTAPLLVALGVGLSGFSVRFARLVIVGLFLAALPLSYLSVESFRAEQENATWIKGFADQHSGQIYAHRADVRYLRYFSRFRDDDRFLSFRLEEGMKPPDFRQSWVAVNKSMLLRHTEDSYPPEIINPPPSWKEVARFERSEPLVERALAGTASLLRRMGMIPEKMQEDIQKRLALWSLREPVIIYRVGE